MKKLGVITSFALAAFLAVAVIPAGAQTPAGTTASVTVAEPAPNSTPAPASVTNNLNLIPSLAPKPGKAAASSSSDSYHRFEVFAGYSFLSNEISVVDDGEFQEINHGYAASVKFNLNRNIGILADFSGHNGGTTHSGVDQDQDMYYFLFGPEISHSFGKARISGHVTVGAARQRYNDNFSGEGSDSGKDTNFAMGVGGSFDWMFSERWGFRILQFDYLRSIFNGQCENACTSRINNVRGSTGIIVRFK